jgi:hypothetical protein
MDELKISEYVAQKRLEWEHDRLISLRRVLSQYSPTNQYYINQRLVRMVMAWMDDKLGRENRIRFLREVFQRDNIVSSKDLKDHEAMGLLMWAKPTKLNIAKGSWRPSVNFADDIRLLQTVYQNQTEAEL